MIKDNNVYETSSEKANLFANILKSTFADNNYQSFDSLFKHKIETEFKNKRDFSIYNNPKQVFNVDDLNDAIKKLKPHSAPGRDLIHKLMIKNSNFYFKKLILHLINLTVEQNIMPQGWKESPITMIPKKKANSDNPEDNRPISLTSNIAKLAEKLIAIKIKEFLGKNKIIIKTTIWFPSSTTDKR